MTINYNLTIERQAVPVDDMTVATRVITERTFIENQVRASHDRHAVLHHFFDFFRFVVLSQNRIAH